MKKVTKYLASMAIALCCFLCVQGASLASTPITENLGDYMETYSAEEITDFNILLQKATANSRFRSENDCLSVTQLLKVREYEDGFIEKDYAYTEFALDEETARRAGVISQGSPTSNTHLNNDIQDYSASCTLYYTARLYGTSEFDGIIQYKVSKVVGQIVKTHVTGVTITKASLGYVLNKNSRKETNCSYKNSAGTGGQTFTLSCSDTGWYPCGSPDYTTFFSEGLGGYFEVYASNGEHARIITMPKEA